MRDSPHPTHNCGTGNFLGPSKEPHMTGEHDGGCCCLPGAQQDNTHDHHHDVAVHAAKAPTAADSAGCCGGAVAFGADVPESRETVAAPGHSQH